MHSPLLSPVSPAAPKPATLAAGIHISMGVTPTLATPPTTCWDVLDPP